MVEDVFHIFFHSFNHIQQARPEDWWRKKTVYNRKNMNKVTPAPYVPRCAPKLYYVSVNKDPDPNDVLGEQDELWDDENFIDPEDGNRVFKSFISNNCHNKREL